MSNFFKLYGSSQCPGCELFTALKPSAMVLGLVFAASSHAQSFSNISGLLQTTPQLDTTQQSMADVIEVACPRGTNLAEFQTRCDAVISAAQAGATSDVLNSLQQVSPEQIPSQGVSATRTSFNVIAGRLAAIRAGARGFQVARPGI